MKTTEQIHTLFEMNNYSERDISQDIWYSEEEIKSVLSEYKNKCDCIYADDYTVICEIEKTLFGDGE